VESHVIKADKGKNRSQNARTHARSHIPFTVGGHALTTMLHHHGQGRQAGCVLCDTHALVCVAVFFGLTLIDLPENSFVHGRWEVFSSRNKVVCMHNEL
jgi:hypothetical protein